MEKNKMFYGWWIVIGSILFTTALIPPAIALFSKFALAVSAELSPGNTARFMTNTMIIQLVGAFLSPFAAKFMAKRNFRNIQSLCVIAYVLAYASYSLAQNVWHLYISSLFIGLFFLCSTLIPVTMMISNWFVAKRGMAMSIAMTGIGLGGFIFSPIITYLLENYGWRTGYQIMALIMIVVALPIILFIFRVKPEEKGLRAYGLDENGNPIQEEKKKNVAAVAEPINISAKESFVKPFFFLLIIGMFANGLINGGALQNFPPALQKEWGSGTQWIVISLYSIIGVVGKIALGWLNDRFGVVWSTVFGVVTFGLSFVCMLFSEMSAMVYLMSVVFGLGIGIGAITPSLLTASVYGQKQYGEAFGYINSATQLGLALGGLMVAAIADSQGNYKLAWMIMLALTVLTLFTWIAGFKGSRKYCGNAS